MTGEYAAQGTKVVAFYAYPANLGCSGMVANIALILGSFGYRVLAVDQNFADPSLYRYMSPFLPEQTPLLQETAINGAYAPIPLECHFAEPRGAVALLGPTTPDATASRARIQRAELADADYDFVLIDMPTGTEAVPLSCELADIVVLGYNLNKRFITKVAADAQAIRDGERGAKIQILPVPLRVDRSIGAASTTELMLVAGRLQFSYLLDDMPEARRQHYLTEVQIPYEPAYTIDEGLAFLDDSSAQRDHLVGAYKRLADEIAHGRHPAARPAVTDESRARYRASRLAAVGESAVVTVLHAPVDRYWAEWLVSDLQRMNLTVSRQRIDQPSPTSFQPPSKLLVVSDGLLNLPGRDGYLAGLASPPASGQARLAVSVDGATLPADRFPAHADIDLGGLKQEQAHAALASYYRVAGVAPSGRRQPHYPGSEEKDASPPSNLPSREATCYGRDDEIDRIRDYFNAGEASAPLTVAGPPGIGKSELALEYASRFARYYNLVFRIQADSAQSVRAGLTEMADRLPDLRPAGDAAVSALRYLDGHPSAPERWLLIYDGAETPEALNGLLPAPGSGHVLITSRTPTVVDSAEVLDVPPLTADAARATLTELVPGILPAEADRIAAALNCIPLAIRLTSGWLNVVARQLYASGMTPATLVSNAVRELIDQFTAEATGPADDLVRLAFELLLRLLREERHDEAALLLLETCAFLAPAGMSDRLLRSAGMLSQLAQADPDFADPVLVNNVRSTLADYGFTVSALASQDPLCLHPRVRELLRDRVSSDQQAARSAAVSKMLAAYAPIAIEDDVAAHEIYAELLPHVEPSNAPLQADAEVRRWLVNEVRFLWQRETTAAWRMAADLGERLAQHWGSMLVNRDDDPLLLRLRTQLGNVYRSLCQFDRAHAIDLDVLSRQRRVLGLTHLRTLMTARSYGADLRLTGRFEEALNVDQSTWQAFKDTLGSDHVMTIRASDNMALSELLCGYADHALRRQQEDVRRAERIKSQQPAQKPWVLFNVGTLQRELGLYEESRRSLDEAKYEFDTLVGDGKLAPTLWVVLRTAAGLAITERRLGMPNINATRAVLKTCRETYGDDYPDVLALELSLAGDLHWAEHHEEAVAQADESRVRCITVFGHGHPLTNICEIDQSIYALAAGQTEFADELSSHALAALTEILNPGHPWVQAAAVARANVLAVTGHSADALRLEDIVLAEYQRQLKPGNPLLRTVAINRANSQLLLNHPGAIPDSEKGLQRRRAIEIDIPPY